jgi:EAL domain-containing protein (putative c-di-GMP-specific phosphodiesterase class I)
LLKQYDIDPKCLVFEITESLLLPNDDISNAALTRLSGLGLVFSVDDFGTGYSSLSTIQNAPIGQLKIDRKFISQLNLSDQLDGKQTECRETELVKAILSLAGALGLEVVAEGVETDNQKAALETLGCHSMQGYLFSKPVPAEEIPELLRSMADSAE